MFTSIVSAFQAGGFIMYILAVLSLIGLAIAFERLRSLRTERLVSGDLMAQAKTLWQTDRFEDLRILAESRSCVMSRVLSSILRHRSKSFDRVSMIASDAACSVMKRELQRIYPLNIIATLSPLIGLFGTVIGMISSFRMIVITGVSGDATIIADGISQALVTTAAGLIVGIPALAFYHYFKNRLSRFGSLIEDNANIVLYDWLLDKQFSEPESR